MIMSMIAIIITAGIAYIWVSRGFFSAFLNLMCVIAGGAIAFAFWEPLAYLLLDKAPQSGFLSFLGGTAWGLSLGLLFAISVSILRLMVDGVVRANVKVPEVVDYIGGGICGVAAGGITSGIVVMSVGMLRLGDGYWGYQPVHYASSGNLEIQGGLMVPFDKWTAGLYGQLSQAAFRPMGDKELATWYPELQTVGPAMRISYGGGKAMNTIRPSDFQVVGRYRVGGDGIPLEEVLTDRWFNNYETSQNATNVYGEPFPQNSHVEGFVINFEPGAKERGGDAQVVMGAGQIRLVAQSNDGSESIPLHPIAVVTQADSADVRYARFWYDQRETYIASVGGAAETRMAFEFVIPPNFTPVGLYVKNARVAIGDTDVQEIATPEERDAWIDSGQLVQVDNVLQELTGDGMVVRPDPNSTRIRNAVILPTNRIGPIIQKGTERGLTVNEDNMVVSGNEVYPEGLLSSRARFDRALRIDKFVVGNGQVLVQVDVSMTQPVNLLLPAASDRSRAVRLVDTNGQAYLPVGWVYKDDQYWRIRYTPSDPIDTLSELDAGSVGLSRSRPSQELKLVFLCSFGVEIEAMAIGNERVATFQPPVKLDQTQ